MDRAVFATTCAHQVGQAAERGGDGVQPEGDVHGGGWQQAPNAQKSLAHVLFPS